MGKIFTRLSVGLGSIGSLSGIGFKQLSDIINALPGNIAITKIDLAPNSYQFLVEAENSSFLDGTEVVGQWISSFQAAGPNQAVPSYTIFKGVTIIDPQPQQVSIPVNITLSPFPLGGSAHISAGGNGSATFGFPPYKALAGLHPPSSDDFGDDDLADSSACVCGAGSVGGAHSSWCPA